MKIAIIGAGISGIAAAHTYKKNGFTPVVLEKNEDIGGVWFRAYPEVHLQNIYTQYRLSDVPWPSRPDFHPSGQQIRNYLQQVINQSGLDVRTGCRVISMEERAEGWAIRYDTASGTEEIFADFAVIATGQYSLRKIRPEFPGQSAFKGQILTELDIPDYNIFKGKTVAVAGFGKSALDMTSFAAEKAGRVHHIFRTPHWLLTETMLGLHFTRPLFSRMGTVMMPAWGHASGFARALHEKAPFVVSGFWKMIAAIFRFEVKKHGRFKDPQTRARLETISPKHALLPDVGAKTAVSPDHYIPWVAQGKIEPWQGEFKGYYEGGIELADGRKVPCDTAVICFGYDTMHFPFLPDKYRRLLEGETDGVQLYRHMIHPDIPRLVFAGYNHGFMHVPTIEIGTHWISAWLKGELQLPSREEMIASMERMAHWKRSNINYDPGRCYFTGTRYQQYIDVLLKDLRVSPYRKMPNFLAEVFTRYEAVDYKDVWKEYRRNRLKSKVPYRPLNIDM